ncbi:hypothetical protein SAMN04489732_104210 [Amycolatopsis saalfeldensis]|uniref:Uncharacterized protein n=1 Tax=Amycolatopsis saalfeldensis TaxID=394193 RepID=A0A1H8VPU5_9PSEU|nr:hypothetical protein SAMN04489732_104210 [Amycolatopsis saalfeldensis]
MSHEPRGLWAAGCEPPDRPAVGCGARGCGPASRSAAGLRAPALPGCRAAGPGCGPRATGPRAAGLPGAEVWGHEMWAASCGAAGLRAAALPDAELWRCLASSCGVASRGAAELSGRRDLGQPGCKAVGPQAGGAARAAGARVDPAAPRQGGWPPRAGDGWRGRRVVAGSGRRGGGGCAAEVGAGCSGGSRPGEGREIGRGDGLSTHVSRDFPQFDPFWIRDRVVGRARGSYPGQCHPAWGWLLGPGRCAARRPRQLCRRRKDATLRA